MLFQRLLTKKELCYIFGLVSPGGHPYYKKLREKYMTDKVLKDIGVDPAEYDSRSTREFDQDVTRRIIERFRIQASERIQPEDGI